MPLLETRVQFLDCRSEILKTIKKNVVLCLSTKEQLSGLTFLLFSVDGLRMVSSGRLGLGLGDSQELKKDWMKGSRFCPFWKKDASF